MRTEWQERIGVGERQYRPTTWPQVVPIEHVDGGVAGYQTYHKSGQVDATVKARTIRTEHSKAEFQATLRRSVMAFWKKEAPQEQKKTSTQVPEHDQLDVLKHLWLARLLEAGGDTAGASVARSYAALADAANEAKYMHKAYPDNPDWEHRARTLRNQLREERRFWREIRESVNPGLVAITYEGNEGFQWPSDADLLAGA